MGRGTSGVSGQLKSIVKQNGELCKNGWTDLNDLYVTCCIFVKGVKVGFLYSATYTANQNSALHNLRTWQLIGNSQWCCGAMRSIHCPR